MITKLLSPYYNHQRDQDDQKIIIKKNDHQPRQQTEEGVEGDKGNGNPHQHPNCPSRSPPIRDVVDIPGEIW